MSTHINQSLILKWMIRGESFAQIEKLTSVDEREKIVKSPVSNEYTCLYYAMYNSLKTEKHRMAFSKGNLHVVIPV